MIHDLVSAKTEIVFQPFNRYPRPPGNTNKQQREKKLIKSDADARLRGAGLRKKLIEQDIIHHIRSTAYTVNDNEIN